MTDKIERLDVPSLVSMGAGQDCEISHYSDRIWTHDLPIRIPNRYPRCNGVNAIISLFTCHILIRFCLGLSLFFLSFFFLSFSFSFDVDDSFKANLLWGTVKRHPISWHQSGNLPLPVSIFWPKYSFFNVSIYWLHSGYYGSKPCY